MSAVQRQGRSRSSGVGHGLIAQFKTEDDAIWVVSTSEMTWARVSSPGAVDTSEVLDSGKLTAQGPYIFALDGRTPETEAPGAGLCALMFLPALYDDTLHIVLRTNVNVKDFQLLKPITQVRYEIMNPISDVQASTGLPTSAVETPAGPVEEVQEVQEVNG